MPGISETIEGLRLSHTPLLSHQKNRGTSTGARVSSLMTCLVRKWFTLFFAWGHLYIPKEQPITCSFVVTTGLLKGSTAGHVLTWKQSGIPGSMFICTEPHVDSWLSICWCVILSFLLLIYSETEKMTMKQNCKQAYISSQRQGVKCWEGELAPHTQLSALEMKIPTP